MDDKDFRRSSNVEDRTGEGFLSRYSSWFTPPYTADDLTEMLKHPMTPARDLLPNNFGTAQVPPSPLGVDAGYNDIPSFLDPAADARAQAQGGGLMAKMMGYLHNKANTLER